MKLGPSMIVTAVVVSGLSLALNAIGAPASHLPATHKEGEVTYLTGGVGKTEADAIKHAAGQYPLELEFLKKATPKNEYVAGVMVHIKDGHDKTMLDVKADGPFLLASMPAGKYTVTAERNGKVEQRKVEIAGKQHRRVVFEWRS